MESLLGVDFGTLIEIGIAIDVVFTDKHAPRNSKKPVGIEDQSGDIGDRPYPTGEFQRGVGKRVPSGGACHEPRDLLGVRHCVSVNELGATRVPREIQRSGPRSGERADFDDQAL